MATLDVFGNAILLSTLCFGWGGRGGPGARAGTRAARSVAERQRSLPSHLPPLQPLLSNG